MVRAVFIVFAMLATGIGPLVYAGPQLMSDLAVGQWTLADDLKVKESACKSWYFLVSTCDVEYVSRREPNRAGGSLHYLVLGSNWAGEYAVPLRATDDPGRITTTLGVEHMRQRLVSFGVFVVFALVMVFAVFRVVATLGRSDPPTDSAATDAPGLSNVRFEPAPATRAGPRSFGQRADQPSRAG